MLRGFRITPAKPAMSTKTGIRLCINGESSAIGLVRPSVCLSVRFHRSFSTTLPSLSGIESQGHRSRSSVTVLTKMV